MAAALLWACAPATAQTVASTPSPDNDAGTLQVSGQAQVEVEADRTVISFAVETEASSARAASRSNAEKMDAVFKALRQVDIQGLELETFGYSLSPEYQRPRPPETTTAVIAGYRATNQVRATFPGTDRAGEVLDAGIGAGANRVVNLAFQASDTREARLRALTLAVESATEEAGTMARAMGVRLGPALEVRGGSSAENPRPMAMAFRSAEAAAPSTPVEAGTQTVSANVTITFRILEGSR
jgi:uncharacterized protein YggE